MQLSKQLIIELLNNGFNSYKILNFQPTEEDLKEYLCDSWIYTNAGFVMFNSKDVLDVLN